MTRTSRARHPSAVPALCAAVLIAGLGGLVIERRTDRLRWAYEAHRLLDEIGHLENELRWLNGERDGLVRPAFLRARAEQIGLKVRRGDGAIVHAPRPASRGRGQ